MILASPADSRSAPRTAGHARTAAAATTGDDNEAHIGLVQAMARADADAFAGFYDRFSPVVMALYVRMLGSRAEAEDLVHDVFLEAWRRAPDYTPQRGTVLTWLMVLARSRALDRLRSGNRRHAKRDQIEASVAAAGRTAPLPDDAVSFARRRAAVRAALARLSDVQREALELAYYRGLSHSDIAAQIGAPLGTVKSRIISAMKQLRGELADHRAEGES